MEIITSFGEWVQKRRNLLGLIRRDLAQHVGCSPAMIKKIERDERRPSVQIAKLLATTLQIPAAEHETFIRRARGEFVPRFGSPLEMDMDEANAGEERVPQHNLPPQTMPFIGRETELAQIATNLANPHCRLLTILAAGGMGKTRLAIQAAEVQLPNFTDGIIYVSLAPVPAAESAETVSSLVRTIIDALKMLLHGNDTPENQLISYLRRKELLLVLDNFEHLLTTVHFIGNLIQQAPDLKILTTSRERLNLQEEWLLVLQGLPFPKGSHTNLESQSFSAIQLFAQRAQQVHSSFTLQDELPAVLEICRLVEGMPLGVELAAAWVPQLSCSEIAQEIARELDILNTTLNNIPDRHRNIRAVFDTSWQRMSEDEQRIFSQCSIFRDGFTRKAGRAITGVSLFTLGQLVNKSLIQYDHKKARYFVHELLRQYAAEKLAQDGEQETAVRHLHSAYYCQTVHKRAPLLQGNQQLKTIQELQTDLENIQVAWRWAAEHDQTQHLEQAIDGIGHTYEWLGQYREGEILFRIASQSIPSQAPPDLVRIKAKLLAWQSIFNNIVIDKASAVVLCHRSLALLNTTQMEGLDTRSYKAFALYQLGRIIDNFDTKKDSLENSLRLFRELGDLWNIANVLQIYGRPYTWFNSVTETEEILKECLSIRQGFGDQKGICEVLVLLSYLERYRSQFETAFRLGHEALQLAQEIKSWPLEGEALHNLGMSHFHLAQFEDAWEIFFQCAKRHQELGNPSGLTYAHNGLGLTALSLGNIDEAKVQSNITNQTASVKYGDYLQAFIQIAEASFDQASSTSTKALALSIKANDWIFAGAHMAILAITYHAQSEFEQARHYAYQALEISVKIKYFVVTQFTLMGVVLLLSENNEFEQAIEIDALARFKHPMIEQAWFWKVIRQPFNKRINQLPHEVVTAAQKRGRELDYWPTVEGLLKEITKKGWGQPL